MRFSDDLCCNWNLKKSAILFGCLELCLLIQFFHLIYAIYGYDKLYGPPIIKGLVCVGTSVFCYGIYIYGVLKVMATPHEVHIKNYWITRFSSNSAFCLQNKSGLLMLSFLQPFVFIMLWIDFVTGYMIYSLLWSRSSVQSEQICMAIGAQGIPKCGICTTVCCMWNLTRFEQ